MVENNFGAGTMRGAEVRRILFSLIAVGVFCFLASVGAPEKSEKAEHKPVDPRSLKFPPLEFRAPKADRTLLDNGMVVYTLEDHLLPIINITSAINVGEIYVPPEKAGLAALTGHVMRTGGTKKMTPEEVDKALEYVAASVSVDIERERGTASMSCLKKDLDSTLQIFADILTYPTFAQEKIDKRKKELVESFRRENDIPDEIAGREFRKLIYKEHPYARRVSGYPDTIEKTTRDDLVRFHERFFHPNNIILGVSGDFDKQQMLDKLKESFADWKKADIDFPPVAEIPEKFHRSLNLVEKEIEQSSVVLGHLGLERLNPDFYAASVMNFILGQSGFNSRLVENVRTKAGLAYSVGSLFAMPRYKGMFLCYFQTATPNTRLAVEKTIAELKRIRTEKVPPEEFRRAKDAMSNRFVFRFTTSRGIIEQVVSIEYEGLPLDYLDTYLQKIAEVTPEDVLRVAKKYIHPDRITLLVVGNKEAVKTFPEDWGKFNVIELSGAFTENSSVSSPDKQPERHSQDTQREP